jgi:hypothetical protein
MRVTGFSSPSVPSLLSAAGALISLRRRCLPDPAPEGTGGAGGPDRIKAKPPAREGPLAPVASAAISAAATSRRASTRVWCRAPLAAGSAGYVEEAEP